MKGTVSSSYKHVRKRAPIHATTVLMDEYLTSQVCSCCHEKVKDVYRHKHVKKWNHKTKERETLYKLTKLHNVLRCPTQKNHNLLKRDLNSAKNMADLLDHYLIHGERLAPFCRPINPDLSEMEVDSEEESSEDLGFPAVYAAMDTRNGVLSGDTSSDIKRESKRTRISNRTA
jgi:hypothetical protein